MSKLNSMCKLIWQHYEVPHFFCREVNVYLRQTKYSKMIHDFKVQLYHNRVTDIFPHYVNVWAGLPCTCMCMRLPGELPRSMYK